MREGGGTSTTTSLLLSKLHLRILQALLTTQQRLQQRPVSSASQELLTVADVEAVVKSLRRLMGGAGRLPKGEGLVAMALDRLAQVVQVTLSSGSLHTTRGRIHAILGDSQSPALVG